MRQKKITAILLLLLFYTGMRAQQFDIGLKLFVVKQEGYLLNTMYSGYQGRYEVNKGRTCIGGHFGVYQPMWSARKKQVSFGPESGLYFAYNRKKHTVDQAYFDLQVAQSKIARSTGVIEIPVMASIREGKFSGVPGDAERCIGLSAGANMLYLYVSNERAFHISPSISGMFGFGKHVFLRADILTRPYKSEYETSLGPIPRLSNKCWAISLNVAL